MEVTDHQDRAGGRSGHSEEKSKLQPDRSDSTAQAKSTRIIPQTTSVSTAIISSNPKPIYARLCVPGMINAPLRRVNPPLPSAFSIPAPSVTVISERQIEKQPAVATSKVVEDLTLVDSDDEMEILSEMPSGSAVRHGSEMEGKKKRSRDGVEKKQGKETSKGKERAKEKEKQVIPAAKASRGKSQFEEAIAGPSKAKKAKRRPTLAELIKARKANKAGPFATLEGQSFAPRTLHTPSSVREVLTLAMQNTKPTSQPLRSPRISSSPPAKSFSSTTLPIPIPRSRRT